MLIKGPASPLLCEKVEKRTGADVAEVKTKVFPDGEIYVKIEESVKDKDCTIIQTTYPNEHLLELLMIQDALKKNGASSINTIVPYYSYARQDKLFERGEAVTADAIAKMISLNADEFFSIDLHSEEIVDFFDIKAENISAMPQLAKHCVEEKDPDLLIAPDEGAKDMVKKAADEVRIDWDYLEKNRIDANTVEIKPKNIKVEGKSVVILDDIISTGGTMSEAARQLKEAGAEKVHAGCTHGLFVDDAKENLDAFCDSVFCTDTIEQDKSEVSVASILAEFVQLSR